MSKGSTRNSGQKASLRAAMVRKYGRRCWICGEDISMNTPAPSAGSFTIDHVKRLKDGGGWKLSNCRPAHRRCNAGREI